MPENFYKPPLIQPCDRAQETLKLNSRPQVNNTALFCGQTTAIPSYATQLSTNLEHFQNEKFPIPTFKAQESPVQKSFKFMQNKLERNL